INILIKKKISNTKTYKYIKFVIKLPIKLSLFLNIYLKISIDLKLFKFYYPSKLSKASKNLSICSSVCFTLKNIASNCDGGILNPLFNIYKKYLLNLSPSQVFTSS